MKILIPVLFLAVGCSTSGSSIGEEILNAENFNRKIAIEDSVRLWEYQPKIEMVDEVSKSGTTIIFTDMCLEKNVPKKFCAHFLKDPGMMGACFFVRNPPVILIRETSFNAMGLELQLKTLAHEIGHCLGHIEHSENPSDIMYSYPTWNESEKTEISESEKSKLWNGIGKGSTVKFYLLRN